MMKVLLALVLILGVVCEAATPATVHTFYSEVFSTVPTNWTTVNPCTYEQGDIIYSVGPLALCLSATGQREVLFFFFF
jgi:hypothetical protein